MAARVARRYRAERSFRFLGLAALLIAVGFLAFLLVTMIRNGATGFLTTEMRITLTLDPATLELGADRSPAALRTANYQAVVIRDTRRDLGEEGLQLVSLNGWTKVRSAVLADPSLIGRTTNVWVPVKSPVDQWAKGRIDRDTPPELSPVTPKDVAAWERLTAAGETRTAFNWGLFRYSDSTQPEMAGIRGAFIGSLLTILVTLALAFPIGVLAAVYLEEYAPKNRWTDLIEVSINNLAAVPSIIFGLLGLAIFLNTMGLPRSAPLVGGMTLALMTLPVIVIAARAAIKAVPPSIRDAALGVGASPVQVVFHHVLPLALPGMLTGTILGMARALGETAPLLMIGMRAFLTSVPQGLTQPATALPVQIFIWSDNVSRGFVEKTSGAIIVLLLFLLAVNSLAIYLRNRFEVRW